MAKPQEVEVKVVDAVEKELGALGTICRELDDLQPETRQRMFRFLESKYQNDWPRSNY